MGWKFNITTSRETGSVKFKNPENDIIKKDIT
jgi:hypothetical protein